MTTQSARAAKSNRSGRYLAELVRALAVVALVFLNFGHSPVLAHQADPAIQSLCGDALVSGDAEHGQHQNVPCHACRIGGAADLPPLPADVDCVLALVGDVVYAAGPVPPQAAVPQQVGSPRGPPVLA
jgi:hypothetical protein